MLGDGAEEASKLALGVDGFRKDTGKGEAKAPGGPTVTGRT